MLGRIENVIEANRAFYSALSAEREGVRKAVWGIVVSGVSLIAIPASIILSVFGANVAEVQGNPSIFDVQRFFVFYSAVFGGFAAILLLGLISWMSLHFLALRRAQRAIKQQFSS